MISFFRRALSSWLVLGLLGLVMVAFIVTGVNAPSGLGGLGGGDVAEIGGESLTEAEFAQRVQTQFENARRENPALDITAFLAAGGAEQTLDQVLAAKAVEIWARKQGIGASERLIDGEIASVAAFAGPTGQFDQNVFRSALAQRKISEQMLRQDIAGDVIRRQVLVPVGGAATAPAGLAKPYASLLVESRSGIIGVVPTEAMPAGPAPAPAEVESFYRQNIARYTLPERRVIRYAAIGVEKLGATTPTDAEIQAYYRANAARYAGQESRTLSQVVLPDEAAAKAFAAKVKAGTPFATAAQQAGFSASDIALGQKTREQMAEIASASIAAAAFALPEGGVTAPAKSEFGWHVVRVDAVRAVAGRPLAAVRGEIVEALTQQKTQDALTTLVTSIEESIADGATFDDVVKARGLAAVTTAPLLPNGVDPARPGVGPTAELQPLLKTAFEVAADDDPTVEALGPQTFALLDVSQVVPSAPRPLATIRDQVAQDLRARRASERARAVAGAILQKVKSGVPMAQAFAQAGVPLPAPEPVSGRQIDLQRGQGVPPPLRTLFTMKRGDTRLLAAPENRGWFVINLRSVTPGDAAKEPGLIEATREQFAQLVGQEYLEQFINSIQKELGVSRDKAAVERVKAQLRGGAGGQ